MHTQTQTPVQAETPVQAQMQIQLWAQARVQLRVAMRRNLSDGQINKRKAQEDFFQAPPSEEEVMASKFFDPRMKLPTVRLSRPRRWYCVRVGVGTFCTLEVSYAPDS